MTSFSEVHLSIVAQFCVKLRKISRRPLVVLAALVYSLFISTEFCHRRDIYLHKRLILQTFTSAHEARNRHTETRGSTIAEGPRDALC